MTQPREKNRDLRDVWDDVRFIPWHPSFEGFVDAKHYLVQMRPIYDVIDGCDDMSLLEGFDIKNIALGEFAVCYDWEEPLFQGSILWDLLDRIRQTLTANRKGHTCTIECCHGKGYYYTDETDVPRSYSPDLPHATLMTPPGTPPLFYLSSSPQLSFLSSPADLSPADLSAESDFFSLN